MATRQEQLLTILDLLTTNGGNDITGAAVVSMDGILLAARVGGDVNTDRVAAVAATMIGVTRRVSNEIKIGEIEETIIKARDGLFMVLPASDQSLLAINLRQGANLGLVRLEARDAANSIGRIV